MGLPWVPQGRFRVSNQGWGFAGGLLEEVTLGQKEEGESILAGGKSPCKGSESRLVPSGAGKTLTCWSEESMRGTVGERKPEGGVRPAGGALGWAVSLDDTHRKMGGPHRARYREGWRQAGMCTAGKQQGPWRGFGVSGLSGCRRAGEIVLGSTKASMASGSWVTGEAERRVFWA